jgi:hypothetical protein
MLLVTVYLTLLLQSRDVDMLSINCVVLQREVPHRGGAGWLQGEHAAPDPELRGGGRGCLHVHIHQLTRQD